MPPVWREPLVWWQLKQKLVDWLVGLVSANRTKLLGLPPVGAGSEPSMEPCCSWQWAQLPEA
jgi:hypothetical protein